MSLMLAGALAAGLLAGCGSGETSSEEEVSTAAAEEETSFDGFDELIEIEMYGLGFYGDDGLEEVIAAVNEISEAEINVHVNYTVMDVATYMEQIGLMMSGGEAFDLVLATAIPVVGFTTMQSQNELMDISEYLDVYGQDMQELMADYMACMTVDDAVYGVPCYYNFNTSCYIVMRTDILEELGLTEEAQAIDSWSDYEAILQQVYDAQDELPEDMQTNAVISNQDAQGTVLTGSASDIASDDFSENYGFDTLGDTNKIIYVDEDGIVQNYFATEDYAETIERVHSWYEEGLIYKDAATSSDTGDTQMANGVTFSYIVQAQSDVEVSKSNATGYDVTAVEIHSLPMQTTTANVWGWCVPTTSENPEAAVAFMNLMYTSEEIQNLFVYGIEGRDYEVNDEGEAVLLDTLEYQSSDWLFGNQFLCYPAEGSGGDYRETALAGFDDMEFSEYFGLTINTDEISNELTAISNVLSKYEAGLESGVSDPALIDTMLEEMEDAGIQTVLDYYQEQLDAWVAEQ